MHSILNDETSRLHSQMKVEIPRSYWFRGHATQSINNPSTYSKNKNNKHARRMFIYSAASTSMGVIRGWL